MVNFEYKIKDEIGLHARPVGLIAKAAGQFDQSKITISCKDKSAEAKRIIAIMAMQIKKGDTVTVSVEGGDENLVSETIHNIFITENL